CQTSTSMGIAFAVAGWFQIIFGAVMVARPKRWWLPLAIVAKLLFVAVWAWSRSRGLPAGLGGDGGDGGDPVSVVDGFCVALE
ncbi:hypothetical protein NL533_34370, partial [Klebsiella pneumoniae]|nr:hypothetical protein [Klebsiella pneumoniae]